jgi:hypothetical protein
MSARTTAQGGRSALTGAGSFDVGASDNAGDFIFVQDGSYTCGLTLLGTQRVIGDGSSSDLASIITSITGTPYTPVTGSSLPAFSGTDPTLSSTGTCLTLGSTNTIRGVTISPTAAGATASAARRSAR